MTDRPQRALLMKGNKITRPVMRYHGAKYRLAPWIMSFFPPHKCYVEPFGGGGSVLMQKTRAYAEVYNDLDGEIVNVFRVLQDGKMSARLREVLLATPYAREEFETAWDVSECPVEMARRTLIRAFMGFGSAGATKGSTGFRIDSMRAYKLAAHLWAEHPIHIQTFTCRLAGVIIEHRPAISVIMQHDAADTLIYADPPYVHESRYNTGGKARKCYRHEMSDDQHRELIEVLRNCQGSVVLSGYPSDLYSEMLSDWTCHQTKARISANTGTSVRIECVWLNPRCKDMQGQQRMFA